MQEDTHTYTHVRARISYESKETLIEMLSLISGGGGWRGRGLGGGGGVFTNVHMFTNVCEYVYMI